MPHVPRLILHSQFSLAIFSNKVFITSASQVCGSNKIPATHKHSLITNLYLTYACIYPTKIWRRKQRILSGRLLSFLHSAIIIIAVFMKNYDALKFCGKSLCTNSHSRHTYTRKFFKKYQIIKNILNCFPSSRTHKFTAAFTY